MTSASPHPLFSGLWSWQLAGLDHEIRTVSLLILFTRWMKKGNRDDETPRVGSLIMCVVVEA